MCPICGNPYLIGSDLHSMCAVEQTERAKDSEFLRALRHELDVRGWKYSDFISQMLSKVEDADWVIDLSS
jgi:hypothetical protein